MQTPATWQGRRTDSELCWEPHSNPVYFVKCLYRNLGKQSLYNNDFNTFAESELLREIKCLGSYPDVLKRKLLRLYKLCLPTATTSVDAQNIYMFGKTLFMNKICWKFKAKVKNLINMQLTRKWTHEGIQFKAGDFLQAFEESADQALVTWFCQDSV